MDFSHRIIKSAETLPFSDWFSLDHADTYTPSCLSPQHYIISTLLSLLHLLFSYGYITCDFAGLSPSSFYTKNVTRTETFSILFSV